MSHKRTVLRAQCQLCASITCWIGTCTYLGHLSQCSALFSEVDDDTTAPILSLLDGLFDTEDEIGPAGADVRAENITSVALEGCQLGVLALPAHCCEYSSTPGC